MCLNLRRRHVIEVVTLYVKQHRLTGLPLRFYLYNAPFPWLGSKARMLDIILPNIPEHDYYVEPFCGTAVVFLNKPMAKTNILNDLDGNIVNFFRVLQDRDKTRELLRRLRYTPWAKTEYRKACLLLSSERNLDDVTRAWAFYVAQHMSMKKSYYSDQRFGFSLAGYARYLTLINKVRRLAENAQKMRHSIILNDDGIDVMRRFDNEKTFMFVDPPYLSTTLRSKRRIYMNEYDDSLHHRLLDFVLTAKSKIMLSAYPNEMYDKLLEHGWVRIDKTKFISAGYYTSKRKRRTRRIESLYLNYVPPSQVQTHERTALLPLH